MTDTKELDDQQTGQQATPPAPEEIGGEKKPEIKDETVTLSKKKFDSLLARLSRVEGAADKKGLDRYDKANQKEQGKVISLLMIEGKVVLSWSDMLKNQVEKNPKTNVWGEDQVIKVTFEDGETKEMPYVIFSRRYERLPAKVISETKKENGELYFKVKTDDEKVYEVNVKFVN